MYVVKATLLNALLAYAPGIYLRFFRRGSSRRPVRRLSGESTSAAMQAGEPPRVLVVDSDFPDPTRDAGSKAIFHFVKLLVDEGVRLTFWSASRTPSSRGRARLAELGVESVARQRDCDFPRWLESIEGLKPFDAIVLSRPLVAAIYGWDASLLGSRRCLYYGHDIHYLRLRAMRRVVGGLGVAFEAACMARIERNIWRRQGVVLYPSEEEVSVVNACRKACGLSPNAALLPLWSAPDAPAATPEPAGRRGMLFVGSHAHAPNVDGLDWLFADVLPRARAHGCRDTVYVVGSGMERYVPPVADPAVEVLGWLDEEALEALYARVRVALVPLRYGGGVKGKVLEAMAQGVPCVVTTVAMQGLSAAAPALEPTDGATEFSDMLVSLTADDGRWSRKSSMGLAYMHGTHGRAIVRRRVLELVLGR